MVERFHRQLKAALRTDDDAPAWSDKLPVVLLGIRSSLKEDIGCTAAELVYGCQLRLPGEFLSGSASDASSSPADLASRLRATMAELRPTSPRPGSRQIFVSQDLSDCTHVFLRRESHRSSLHFFYDGPYPVLSRSQHTVTIDRHGRRDTVSLARCKPAYLDRSPPPVFTPPTPVISEVPPLPPRRPAATADAAVDRTTSDASPERPLPRRSIRARRQTRFYCAGD